MKRIKNDWRASLSSETLSSLFVNMNCKTPVSEYNPGEAIKLWWLGGKQHRRTSVKPYSSRSMTVRHGFPRFAGNDSSSGSEIEPDTDSKS